MGFIQKEHARFIGDVFFGVIEFTYIKKWKGNVFCCINYQMIVSSGLRVFKSYCQLRVTFSLVEFFNRHSPKPSSIGILSISK